MGKNGTFPFNLGDGKKTWKMKTPDDLCNPQTLAL